MISDAGVDAYFARTPVAMGYLHGFPEDGHERFLTLAVRANGDVCMICPALSANQAQRAGIKDVRSWRDGEQPLSLFAGLAQDWGLKSGVLAVDNDLPAHMLLGMQEVLPAALFKPGGAFLGEMMSRKESGEIAALRAAGKIADEAFDEVYPQLRAGMTEREVARMLFGAMAARGGNPTFAIVATGANGAEPHHETDDTKLATGDVVILDFGCEWKGYLSDITRVVAIGDPGDKAREVYRIVHASHWAGRTAAQPGVPCELVDQAARDVIEAAGYGPQFPHRTGHGIGLLGHEEPYIVSGNQTPLAAGHCFSIEPGIYLPGEFGVRIENIIAMQSEGPESMNVDPSPELLEVHP